MKERVIDHTVGILSSTGMVLFGAWTAAGLLNRAIADIDLGVDDGVSTLVAAGCGTVFYINAKRIQHREGEAAALGQKKASEIQTLGDRHPDNV